jgi:myo-inositol-1(or 4)-monophosphatase
MFTATKGRGAFLDDRRIRVSKREKLSESLIGTGFPFKKIDNIEQFLRMFKAVTEQASGVRRPGAAALDLAYVAASRYDGFFEFGLSPWDVAAGGLLVREAGGLVGDFHGDEGYLENEEIVAATPKVFAAMLKLLALAR